MQAESAHGGRRRLGGVHLECGEMSGELCISDGELCISDEMSGEMSGELCRIGAFALIVL